MKIQINTDNNVSGNEKMDTYFKTLISDSLKNYSESITRVEVHFSDENASKEGIKDKKCTLEIRMEGRQPNAVTAKANTIEDALNKAIEKVSALLKTVTEKMNNQNKLNINEV